VGDDAGDRTGPGLVTIDLDATIVIAHSDKEQALLLRLYDR